MKTNYLIATIINLVSAISIASTCDQLGVVASSQSPVLRCSKYAALQGYGYYNTQNLTCEDPTSDAHFACVACFGCVGSKDQFQPIDSLFSLTAPTGPSKPVNSWFPAPAGLL